MSNAGLPLAIALFAAPFVAVLQSKAMAPLALVPRSRTTHATDVYDFYKPAMNSEYPAVDGKLSQVSYLSAVDACYSGTMARLGAARLRDAFDHVAFHSPYNKLVQQSFKRVSVCVCVCVCVLPCVGRETIAAA